MCKTINTIVSILPVFLFYSCSNPNFNKPYSDLTDTAFYIEFVPGDLNADTLILVYEDALNEQQTVSGVPNENGIFTFEGHLNEPQLVTITAIGNNRKQQHEIFIENNKLQVKGDLFSFDTWTFNGSKTPSDYKEYINSTGSISGTIWKTDSLIALYQENDEDNAVAELAMQMDSLLAEKRSRTRLFIEQHRRSPVSLNQLILNYYANASPVEIREAWDLLDSNLKKWPDGIFFFKEILTPAINTDIGKIAPDLSLPDRNGKPISLSTLKGKYVLIDFWASWCVPCRKKTPEIRDLYSKYRNKQFEVLSVSLDTKPTSWAAALAQDKHEWVTVIDSAGFTSATALNYGVKAIPYTILIGPDGKVLLRNPSADTLHSLLSAL